MVPRQNRVASRRWNDCIQLYNHFVSPYFCISFRLMTAGFTSGNTARNLPDRSASGSEVFCGQVIALYSRLAGPSRGCRKKA
ncbi:hypothetical protein GC387_04260 [Pseudomonas sp. MWU12-2323]|nr:hypothetical protein [Pseudomonas sp. MWU12-2323]